MSVTMKKKGISKLWLIGLLVLMMTGAVIIAGMGLGWWRRDIPKDPVLVENKSGVPFQYIGLVWDGHCLLYKADTSPVHQAVFPKSLLGGAKSVGLMAISDSKQVLVSGLVPVEFGKPLVITGASSGRLEAANAAFEDTALPFSKLPNLETWEMDKEDNQSRAKFLAEGDASYQLHVLGHGGQLASSGWTSQGETAQVSWELGHGPLMSWLMIKQE